MPVLTGQELRLIDAELKNRNNGLHDRAIITSSFVEKITPWLIQARAALQEPDYEAVITLLTRLRFQLPTQNMSAEVSAVFLEDRYEIIKCYGFFAIKKGIDEIYKYHDGDFFPSPRVMHKYMGPINTQLNARVWIAEKMVNRAVAS